MKLTKTTFFLGCLTGGIGAAFVPMLLTSTHADTKLLPFQGRLTDAAGTAIADGAKVVEFKMYDAPTGGNVKWAGEVHKVSINGGLVNTMLGSKASLGSVDFSTPCYLQITVDANSDDQITAADPPLLPRQSVVGSIYSAVAGQMQYRTDTNQIVAAGWSAVFDNGRPDTGRIQTGKLAKDNGLTNAHLADSAVETDELATDSVTLIKMADGSVGTSELLGRVQGGIETVQGAVTSDKIKDGTIQVRDLESGLQSSVTPPGAVLAYVAAIAPVGWLLCDGRDVSRATYAALFAVIGTTHGVGDASTTFNLPDYRGRFLRAADDSDGPGGLAPAGRDPDSADRTPMATGGNSAANIGSMQGDEIKTHSHPSSSSMVFTGGGRNMAGGNLYNFSWGSTTVSSGVTGGAETRPLNAYVNYLIKY